MDRLLSILMHGQVTVYSNAWPLVALLFARVSEFTLEKIRFVCCFPSLFNSYVHGGRSVHLTTLFLGKLEQAVNQQFVNILPLVTDNDPS